MRGNRVANANAKQTWQRLSEQWGDDNSPTASEYRWPESGATEFNAGYRRDYLKQSERYLFSHEPPTSLKERRYDRRHRFDSLYLYAYPDDDDRYRRRQSGYRGYREEY